MKNILDEAGIEVTPGNRKQIDEAIHQIVAVSDKDCPHTWRKLKQEIISDEQKRLHLIQRLRDAMT